MLILLLLLLTLFIPEFLDPVHGAVLGCLSGQSGVGGEHFSLTELSQIPEDHLDLVTPLYHHLAGPLGLQEGERDLNQFGLVEIQAGLFSDKSPNSLMEILHCLIRQLGVLIRMDVLPNLN